MATCDDCGKTFNPGDGIWDDGDMICGECVARMVDRSELMPDDERGGVPQDIDDKLKK